MCKSRENSVVCPCVPNTQLQQLLTCFYFYIICPQNLLITFSFPEARTCLCFIRRCALSWCGQRSMFWSWKLDWRLPDLAAGFLMVAAALVVQICSTAWGVGPEDAADNLFLQLCKYFCKPLNTHSYIDFYLNYQSGFCLMSATKHRPIPNLTYL